MLEKYPKKVKLVFKNFPLRNHKFAMKAAAASLAAGRQGKFWEFHDLLYKNYNRLSDQKIQEIARGLRLDMEKFNKSMKDPGILATINRDKSEGNGEKKGSNGKKNGNQEKQPDVTIVRQQVSPSLIQSALESISHLPSKDKGSISHLLS